MVDEPTQEDAISILRGLKDRYENHHQVRIKDEAIVAAVELSTRYITSRFLPDKAIDLVDEAASRLRLEMNSVPEEIDTLDRRVRQLEIEREAIRREKDRERVEQLTKEIEELKSRDAEMRAKWQGQRDLLKRIQENKDRIEQLKIEAQQAEPAGRLRQGGRNPLRQDSGGRKGDRRLSGGVQAGVGQRLDDQGGGRCAGRRRGGVALDGYPRDAHAGFRTRETAAHGGRAAPARHRSRSRPSPPFPTPCAVRAPG